MYIGFNIDDTFYSGTATEIVAEGKTVYLIDLNESVHENAQFTIERMADGEWKSEDAANADLLRAAGKEIDLAANGNAGESLVPNTYFSTERTGGQPPVFEDGEVTNEPDDVEEQSAD